MNRQELIDAASPRCPECKLPVQRVEHSWDRTEQGTWELKGFIMVCPNDHRTPVQPA